MSDDVNFAPGMSARVVLDSISPRDDRLTTFEVTMHRFVLAEFNTHRLFSRNSASSRAIPFHKQVARVMNYPAMPVSFPAEQRGMSGGAELEGSDRQDAEFGWLHARNSAVQHAQHLADLGVHKSVVNRILEPFMWHTAIVTATDYDNYFALRCNPMAQPEIRAVSEMMRQAYEESKPQYLDYGSWHAPYITEEDCNAAIEAVDNAKFAGRVADLLKQVSAARCARVSYLTHDGQRDISKDLELYARLTEARPPHSSPLEHVATPSEDNGNLGNYRGWHQLRHQVEREIYDGD